jgi:transposase-like protein
MSHQSGKQIFKRYSESFKQKVVNEIESGALTIHQAQQRYRIGSHGTISNWIKQLGKTHLLAQRVRIETSDEVDQLKQLTTEKRRLESALAQAHLKITTLESQLCQAEQLYGVDIKKK